MFPDTFPTPSLPITTSLYSVIGALHSGNTANLSTLIGRDSSKHCDLIDCDHDVVADASSLTQQRQGSKQPKYFLSFNDFHIRKGSLIDNSVSNMMTKLGGQQEGCREGERGRVI